MAPRLADHKLYFYSTSSPSLLGVVTAYTMHVLSWKYKLDRIPTKESLERALTVIYTGRVRRRPVLPVSRRVTRQTATPPDGGSGSHQTSAYTTRGAGARVERG